MRIRFNELWTTWFFDEDNYFFVFKLFELKVSKSCFIITLCNFILEINEEDTEKEKYEKEIGYYNKTKLGAI